MSSNDAGIQKLIAAESAAQAVIQAARQEKATKIKQAQQEAEKEVAQYKVSREDQYKKMMELGKGDAAGRLTALESETETSIASLEKTVAAKKADATKAILGWVTKVCTVIVECILCRARWGQICKACIMNESVSAHMKDEDISHIFASLTESELERELHLAERQVRTPTPTQHGQGHLRPGYFDSDDLGRISSPLVRCAAAFGPQPLSDQDIDAIQKLVSRMATFAAYRACMPGGLEAVEDMERWQCKVWTSEAEEHAAYIRSQPALPAKQQQRSRGQQQISTTRASTERPSTSRNKSGAAGSQQQGSKKAQGSVRGTGAIPESDTKVEHDITAHLQTSATVPDHPVNSTSRPNSSTHEGDTFSHRPGAVRSQHCSTVQAPVNASAVWNYSEHGLRITSGSCEKLLDGASSLDDECAWIPEEYLYRGGSTGAAPQSGRSKHLHDTGAARASLRGALGPDDIGSRSHKHWIVSMSGDCSTVTGNAESLQRAQEVASQEFYSLCRPDAVTQQSVDHPSMIRALQAQSSSTRVLAATTSTAQDLTSSPLELGVSANEEDTPNRNYSTLQSGMPAAVYGHGVKDHSTGFSLMDESRRQSTTTAIPSRYIPASSHMVAAEELHTHNLPPQANLDDMHADLAVVSSDSGTWKAGNRKRSVSMHTAHPVGPAQQTFGNPRRRFSGAESLYSSHAAKAATELGCEWSPTATAGTLQHSGSSIAYQDIDISSCGASEPPSSASPDPQAQHARLYADSLVTGSHASNKTSARMSNRHDRLEAGEFANSTPAQQAGCRPSSGTCGTLEPCILGGQAEPFTDDRMGSHSGGKATNMHSTAFATSIHACLITGAEVQVPRRPGSGAGPLRAVSTRRLHQARSMTPPANEGTATEISSGLRQGERKRSGRSASNGRRLWKGWRTAARECSGKLTEQSGSFDDSAAVHVPHIDSANVGHTATQDTASHSSAGGGSALAQHSSELLLEQERQNEGSRSAIYKHGMPHNDSTSNQSTSTGLPLALADDQRTHRELLQNRSNTGVETGTGKKAPVDTRSHIEQLNSMPNSTRDMHSTQWLHSQPVNTTPDCKMLHEQVSGMCRESTAAVQGDVDQISTGAKILGPSGGPGALGTAAAGQARARKAGPPRGGKRGGRVAGKGGRGPGHPAAPLMLATFEGPAQGEMRARLDTVRKLQEETAAAEAKSGRGRRLRR